METQTLVIIGNGPSLKEEYFNILRKSNVHTIGMNGAYRFYKKMNWWPTYFCCFDYALTESHKDAWSEMILDPNIPIKKYFLIDIVKRGSTHKNSNLVFAEEVRKHPKFFGKPNNQQFIGYPKYGIEKRIASTGANAVRIGIELGYKRFVLIGHDCRYKQSEKIKEAKQIKGWKYKIDQTPKQNPNYFWNDYQREGDLFHKPGDQLPAWRHLKECVSEHAPDVKIYNCSEGTRINYWKEQNFESVINQINKKENQMKISVQGATNLNLPLDKLEHIISKLGNDEKNSEYAKFLKGKTVAIVGPAEISKGKGEGSYIDSFDGIIRFNTTWEYVPFSKKRIKDIGSRTSIFYFCPSSVINFIQKQSVDDAVKVIKASDTKFIAYLNNHKKNRYRYENYMHQDKLNNFIKQLKEKDVLLKTQYSNKTMAGLSKILSDYSNSLVVARTGCLSIFDCLVYGADTIAIKGMTFYHGGGHMFRPIQGELNPLKQHLNKKSPHNSILEIELLKKMIELYPNKFIIDEQLEKLMR